MKRTGEQGSIREKGVLKIGATLLAGGLALAACGGGGKSSETNADVPAPTGVVLTFDALGGGFPTIQVYPGVTTSLADKASNGVFRDGDKVSAECKTEGRTVHSDPSVGEEDRTSNEWIRITGNPGLTEYATAVYVEDPTKLLSQLPEC